MNECCENNQEWVDLTQPAECDETIWVDDGVQTLWFDGSTQTHWDQQCPDLDWSKQCP